MWFRPYPELREVIVNLKTDTVFRGVLYKRTRTYIVLKNAKLLQVRDKVIPLDGEVLIDVKNVDFIQVVNYADNTI